MGRGKAEAEASFAGGKEGGRRVMRVARGGRSPRRGSSEGAPPAATATATASD